MVLTKTVKPIECVEVKNISGCGWTTFCHQVDKPGTHMWFWFTVNDWNEKTKTQPQECSCSSFWCLMGKEQQETLSLVAKLKCRSLDPLYEAGSTTYFDQWAQDTETKPHPPLNLTWFLWWPAACKYNQIPLLTPLQLKYPQPCCFKVIRFTLCPCRCLVVFCHHRWGNRPRAQEMSSFEKFNRFLVGGSSRNTDLG